MAAWWKSEDIMIEKVDRKLHPQPRKPRPVYQPSAVLETMRRAVAAIIETKRAPQCVMIGTTRVYHPQRKYR